MHWEQRRTALAACLLAGLLLLVWRGRLIPQSGVGLDPADPEWTDVVESTAEGLNPALRVRLGWRVACEEGDPTVWEQVPGIGPTLGRRIAAEARAGALQSPRDLLRIRGIGNKMASRLSPWVKWPPAEGDDLLESVSD